jgi:transposase
LNQNVYYRSKEFLEAAKSGLPAIRPARLSPTRWRISGAELRQLKEALAETLLENRLLKKSVIADGATTNEIFGLREA